MSGEWHASESETRKARDIPAIVLEENPDGTLYIFLPEEKGKTILDKTATIFKRDFTKTNQTWCVMCGAELPDNHFLK